MLLLRMLLLRLGLAGPVAHLEKRPVRAAALELVQQGAVRLCEHLEHLGCLLGGHAALVGM